MAGKKATAADVRLGARIRAARIGACQTQREVAVVLGISAAQLQKYEKGTNRISATDLRLFCGIVRQPISAFFDKPGHAADERDLSAGQAREALFRAVQASSAALRSYQYGNSATELAQHVADACDAALASAAEARA